MSVPSVLYAQSGRPRGNPGNSGGNPENGKGNPREVTGRNHRMIYQYWGNTPNTPVHLIEFLKAAEDLPWVTEEATEAKAKQLEKAVRETASNLAK